MIFDSGSRFYVAGDRGLVGSAIVRQLRTLGYEHIVTRSREDLDLRDCASVREFFAVTRPDYVFLAAAKVGGIFANDAFPADFIRDNLLIETNVIHCAYQVGVKRLLFLGSSCIYPRDSPQPIGEESLLTGPLELTNRPYALAKIAGIEMCWSYNRQFGTRYICAMPTNLYGPGDKYDRELAHVVPALIRKMHECKERGDAEVVVWGTGTPKREFLYSDDLAEACVTLLGLPQDRFDGLLASSKGPPIVNIGYGSDLEIRELAALVAHTVGYRGRLLFDTSKPDGTPRKILNSRRILELGWKPRTHLAEGLALVYQDFLRNVVDYRTNRATQH